MIPINYKGYVIRPARSTGGKAGRGHNKTTSMQIWEKGNFVVKHFSYKVNTPGATDEAIKKCTGWVDKKDFNAL